MPDNVQPAQIVGPCLIWPLEDGQAAPVSLAAPGGRVTERPGCLCATYCDELGTAIKPLDKLGPCRAVWHAHMNLLTSSSNHAFSSLSCAQQAARKPTSEAGMLCACAR